MNSPFAYRAEQKGFTVLFSIKETAEFVKIPINGLSTPQPKTDREPDQIVRMLRAAQRQFVFAKSARDQCRVCGKTLPGRRAVLYSLP
jgi:hypothetical protein